MKVMFTDQALDNLEEETLFLLNELEMSEEAVLALTDKLLDRSENLSLYPYQGQYEPTLDHQNKGHRRLIEKNYKIIYRIEEDHIYVTDFFNTRKDPSKVNG